MHKVDDLINVIEDVNEVELTLTQKAILKNKHFAVNQHQRLAEMKADFLLAEAYLDACLLTHNLVWNTKEEYPYYFCAHRKRFFIELPANCGAFTIRELSEAPLIVRTEIYRVLHDSLDAAGKNV